MDRKLDGGPQLVKKYFKDKNSMFLQGIAPRFLSVSGMILPDIG
jgi:hypothetical protein